MMDDLISRAAAIDAHKRAAYWQDAERKIAELPAVDAIPVEWFTEMIRACGMQGQIGAVAAMNWVLDEWKATKDEWQKKQEDI